MKTKTYPGFCRVCLIYTLAFGIYPASSHAGFKCWTNHDGIRECGNVVPPEYAQQGHVEKSNEGFVIRTQKRAKTQEEIEQERQRAAEKASTKQVESEQSKRDRVLLATFTTIGDLMLTRDSQIRVIDSRIAHTRRIADKLEERQRELMSDAALLERSGKKVPDSLHREIAEVRRQIEENLDSIEDRRRERTELETKFESDLARYKVLKGM